jgi:putative endonuclease
MQLSCRFYLRQKYSVMSSKSENRNKGIQGEQEAASFLIKKGYKIVEMNWFQGKLEVDIIAQLDQKIIFVEVKKRHSKAFAPPWEAVNRKKQRNIMLAAHIYIRKTGCDLNPRFDIISIVEDGSSVIEIEHIEDAFWPMA